MVRRDRDAPGRIGTSRHVPNAGALDPAGRRNWEDQRHTVLRPLLRDEVPGAVGVAHHSEVTCVTRRRAICGARLKRVIVGSFRRRLRTAFMEGGLKRANQCPPAVSGYGLCHLQCPPPLSHVGLARRQLPSDHAGRVLLILAIPVVRLAIDRKYARGYTPSQELIETCVRRMIKRSRNPRPSYPA